MKASYYLIHDTRLIQKLKHLIYKFIKLAQRC